MFSSPERFNPKDAPSICRKQKFTKCSTQLHSPHTKPKRWEFSVTEEKNHQSLRTIRPRETQELMCSATQGWHQFLNNLDVTRLTWTNKLSHLLPTINFEFRTSFNSSANILRFKFLISRITSFEYNRKSGFWVLLVPAPSPPGQWSSRWNSHS